MGELIVSAAGLGIAGVDPFGAMVVIGALTAGATRRTTVAFGLITLVGTIIVGVALSVLVGTQLQNITWEGVLDQEDEVWAVVETMVGTALIVWGFSRIFNPKPDEPKGQEPKGTSLLALLATLPFLVFSTLIDPTFVGITVIASQDAAIPAVALAHTIWNLISQSPLVAILIASFFRLDDELAEWFQRWWVKIEPAMGKIGTVALLLIGGALLLDVAFWLFGDGFIFEW